MSPIGCALFDTAIGTCGVARSEAGVVGIQLPEPRESATRTRLLRRHQGAAEATPPPGVRRAIEDMTRLLGGERLNLSEVVLDMDGVPEFHRRVYEVARSIPPGATLSYGQIARRLGDPSSARAVGQALGENPFPIVVPCHRVLAAGGRMGGFSAPGGVTTKVRMLAIEGALLSG